MKGAWVAVAAMATAVGSAQPLKPEGSSLVTVFTYDYSGGTGVPPMVLVRAKRVATAAFAAAGVEVRWVVGDRLGEPRESLGQMLTVVFDGAAPAHADPKAMAITRVGGGTDADVHIFYNRVAEFKDRQLLPEFLGNVLAHEFTHALEGKSRHSSEGLMKAHWKTGDYAEMARGPLPFAAVDLELLRAHFGLSPATTRASARGAR
jgi:hypothetical protein